MATKGRFFNEAIKRAYFSIRNQHFIYNRIVNYKYRSEWQNYLESSELQPHQRDILDSLERDGVSVCSVNTLVREPDLEKCLSWIQKNEKQAVPRPKKKFLLSYTPKEDGVGVLDLSNPIIATILDKSVLEIVCAYLQYIPQLFEVYIEKTIPVGEAEPQFSQNWHRDPEEKKTLKVFLYLSDVDSNSGPFTYLKGSQPTNGKKDRYARMFPQKLPHGSYPKNANFAKGVNEADIFEATSKAGTIIFCDTAGLHKGGHAKSKSRIMATAVFPSKKYSEKRIFNSIKWDESRIPDDLLMKILN